MSDYKNNDVDDHDQNNNGRDDKEELLCEGARLMNGGKLIDKSYLRKIWIAVICIVGLAITIALVYVMNMIPKITPPDNNGGPSQTININVHEERK